MKHCYPAIFRPKAHNPQGYDLNVVDVEGCLTHGDDIEECFEMAQDALGVMLEGVNEADYPAPSRLLDIDISNYPPGSFVSYVCFDKELYEQTIAANIRRAVFNADNPIRELLNRKDLKIKQLADLLEAPYRTVQEWALGNSKPPAWALKLIVDKVISP